MSGRVRIAHLKSHFTGIVVVRDAHPLRISIHAGVDSRFLPIR